MIPRHAWWERIQHAKRVRDEARKRARHVIRRLSKPRKIR